MKEKTKYMIYVVIFLVVIVLLNFGYSFITHKLAKVQNRVNQGSTKKEVEYKQAKDVTVQDENNQPVQLSSFKGKPIVINFWTSWCGYCKVEMPYFSEVYEKEKEKVSFIMLNVTADDEEEEAKKYIDSQDLSFPIYYDKQGETAYKYQITGYPVTVFINKDFQIYHVHRGAITKEKLQQYIDEIK